jgi:uncharacterized membrane protein
MRKNNLVWTIAAVFCLVALANAASAACNDCVLRVVPVEDSVCRGEPAVFDLEITNVFDQSRAISISAVSDITLQTDFQRQVVIEAYKEETVRATFMPPANAPFGAYRVSMTVSGYGSSDTDDLVFKLNDCYVSALEAPKSLTVCQGDVERFDVRIRNMGQRKDTYTLSVSGIPKGARVDFKEGQISLAPGSSRDVPITLSTDKPEFGKYQLNVNVISGQTKITRTVGLEVKNCHQVDVSAPLEFITCPEPGRLVYTATVTNLGCVAQEYVLRHSGSCSATLSEEVLNLEAGETKQVNVNLAPNQGECKITITASSDYDSDTAETDVRILPCYGVDMEIIPHEQAICAGKPAEYDLRVTNTGFYTQTYGLSVNGIIVDHVINAEFAEGSVTLAMGESKDIPLHVGGTWCVTRDIDWSATAASARSSDTDWARIRLLTSKDACAALNITPAQNPKPMACEGDDYTVYVRNTGYTSQNVVLSVIGPEVYDIQPREIYLAPTESRPATLYLIPSAETPKRPYTITVVAASQERSAYLELNVDMAEPSCRIELPKAAVQPGQVTQPPAPPAEANTTVTPTGQVAGGDANLLMMLAALLIISSVLLILLITAFARQKRSREKASGAGGELVV